MNGGRCGKMSCGFTSKNRKSWTIVSDIVWLFSLILSQNIGKAIACLLHAVSGHISYRTSSPFSSQRRPTQESDTVLPRRTIPKETLPLPLKKDKPHYGTNRRCGRPAYWWYSHSAMPRSRQRRATYPDLPESSPHRVLQTSVNEKTWQSRFHPQTPKHATSCGEVSTNSRPTRNCLYAN